MSFIKNINTGITTECINKDVIKVCKADPLNYIVEDDLEALLSSESSESSDSTTNQPAVDMTPAITKFFTAFQEYSTEKDSPKSRADKMREVATADTVSSLIPNETETGDHSASIAATYTFVKPLEIVADANVAGNYAVVMTYSVKVMENTNQYTDTYIVGTEGGKITSVSKRSSVMDN